MSKVGIPNIKLSNGVLMPQLAIGTAPLSAEPGQSAPSNPRFTGFFPERVYRSVHLALSAGMRHIDTALMYRAQEPIARVLGHWFMEGKLKREDLFISSKIYHPPSPCFDINDTCVDMDNLSVEQVEAKLHEHFQRVLAELGVGYVDLMLLHWPSSGGGAGHVQSDGEGDEQQPCKMADIDANKRAKRIAAWKVLEHYYSIGFCRAIGVSNFHEMHLEHLMEDGAKVRPQVNQIETSVYIQHKNIMKYCRENNIAVVAYSPFGRGVMDIEDDKVIMSIAKKHSVSPGHVALRFLTQQGISAAFLSSSEDRIKSNMNVFSLELDGDDMKALSALNRSASWGLPSPYMLS